MANKICLDIAFNPHGYTVGEIREMVAHGLVTPDDLQRIFGNQDTEQLLHSPLPPTLPAAMPTAGPSDSTLILVWGLPGSGKSTFIASTAALPGMKPEKNGGHDERLTQLVGVFRNTHTAQQLPSMSGENSQDLHHLIYKKNWWSKRYPITFMEMTVGRDDLPTSLLQTERDLIHVFCLDCRQDIHLQAQHFYHVVSLLKSNNLLERTSGIYILVTKTDLMKAPRIYQENAAQTLVTSGLSSFWHTVQDICYDKQIYNTMPLPFSAGRYIVKDMAHLSGDAAAHVFEEALLPKCQPRRTLLGRFLGIGKTWHAVVFGLLLLLLLFYGAYKAFDMLEAPPTSPMHPFDYKKSFLKAEYEMRGSDYTDARSLYKSLRNDLEAERKMTTDKGQPVLSNRDAYSCDSALTADFAGIAERKANWLFDQDNWTQEGTLLRQLHDDLNDLLSRDIADTTMLNTYQGYITTYYEDIKPILTGGMRCHSVEDVEDVMHTVKLASRHPYNNDSTIITRLPEAQVRAFEDCSRYIEHHVDSIIYDYERKSNLWDHNPIFQSERKHSLEIRLNPYLNQVARLEALLEDMEDDAYSEVRIRLAEIRNRIKKKTYAII